MTYVLLIWELNHFQKTLKFHRNFDRLQFHETIYQCFGQNFEEGVRM